MLWDFGGDLWCPETYSRHNFHKFPCTFWRLSYFIIYPNNLFLIVWQKQAILRVFNLFVRQFIHISSIWLINQEILLYFKAPKESTLIKYFFIKGSKNLTEKDKLEDLSLEEWLLKKIKTKDQKNLKKLLGQKTNALK